MSAAMSLLPTDTIVGRRQNIAPIRERIASALSRAVSYSPAPTKELARRLGITPDGAAKLLRGDTSPRAETLLIACREFDEVWAEMRSISERHPDRAERILDELAEKLRERRIG